MEAYEKEEALASEVNSLIDRFVQEYQVTYAQVIGILEAIKSELIHEAYLSEEEEE